MTTKITRGFTFFFVFFFAVPVSAMMEWSVVHSERQSGRKTMEDYSCVHEIDGGCLIGTFDGHGGHQMAEFVHDNLLPYFNETTGTEQERLFNIIARLEREGEELMKPHIDPAKSDPGTTAVIAYVKNNGIVHVAWVGDSRALIIGGKQVVRHTTDHIPTAERERIEKAGDKIAVDLMGTPRLVGSMMSRKLGGYFVKSYAKSLIADPEYCCWQLRPKQMLIVATDGLFNVFSNEECAKTLESYKDNDAYEELKNISPQGHRFEARYEVSDDKVQESVQGKSIFACQKGIMLKGDPAITDYLREVEALTPVQQKLLYSVRRLRDEVHRKAHTREHSKYRDNISIIAATCSAK